MIVQELINENTVRTYSDAGFYIYGGFPPGYYIEAIDPISQHREYVETNRLIVTSDEFIDKAENRKEHLFMEKDRLRAKLAQERNNLESN